MKGKKKGKMSEAQLRALEAVEAFEAASSTSVSEDAEESADAGKKVATSGNASALQLALHAALLSARHSHAVAAPRGPVD